jgi:hypothetical protein
MGIFDAFTGDTAKDAAAANSARLAQLKGEGLGYLDAGKTGALNALDTAGGYYAPISAKYGAGTDLYLDSLGVNGPAGNTRATNAFQSSPGYNFAVDQSLDALDRRAASRGMLASGNNTIDTLNTVHGIADQDYNNWQNSLAGLISPELTGVTGQATTEAAKAPVYTNDANARVALATGVATGQNQQDTQAANAEMQGSSNLWNLGLNLAKLGTGFLGGAAGKKAA